MIQRDLNGDRHFDQHDLDMVLNHIQNVSDPLLRDLSFDLNGDGQVNINDVSSITL
jgi:hypothetical protein